MTWPRGVEPIAVEDLGRLGIDAEGRLFWDGRPVEIRRRLVLSGAQKALAVLVSVVAVLSGFGSFASGLNQASIFLCARNIDLLSCPAAPLIAPERK